MILSNFIKKFTKYILVTLNKFFNNSNIIHINKKQYIDFKYNLYSQQYIYRLQINNDPIIFRNIQMLDENVNDITDRMLKYIGPNYDFHGLKYSPNDFGYDQIHLLENKKIVRSFNKNDIMEL